MPDNKQKFISLGVMGTTALLCAAFFFIRVWHLRQSGQPVNVLAELWAPSSVLSIVIVTFVEKLTAPEKSQKSNKKAKKRKN